MPSPLAELVRRHDPDRFLTALFAPEARREALFALYALNHELARAREAASEPTLALIRLHWWREVVEGARRSHEVATPLGDALDAGLLDRELLLALIDARELEAEPAIPDLARWRAFLLEGAGTLMLAAGRLLGAPPAAEASLRHLGAAYGAAGLLRATPALARQNRCLLPADVLARHGLSPEAVVAEPASPALAPVLRELSEQGRTLLREGGHPRLPRPAVAAALPAVLARRDLARTLPPGLAPGARGLGDRLAVTAAGLLGRV